jgi:hypothetical protein
MQAPNTAKQFHLIPPRDFLAAGSMSPCPAQLCVGEGPKRDMRMGAKGFVTVASLWAEILFLHRERSKHFNRKERRDTSAKFAESRNPGHYLPIN